jgi:hypothetical protein
MYGQKFVGGRPSDLPGVGLVLMAPEAPTLELLHTTSRTIHLRWRASDDGGAPIQGENLIIGLIIPTTWLFHSWSG